MNGHPSPKKWCLNDETLAEQVHMRAAVYERLDCLQLDFTSKKSELFEKIQGLICFRHSFQYNFIA